jgi:hypothetical protein
MGTKVSLTSISTVKVSALREIFLGRLRYYLPFESYHIESVHAEMNVEILREPTALRPHENTGNGAIKLLT